MSGGITIVGLYRPRSVPGNVHFTSTPPTTTAPFYPEPRTTIRQRAAWIHESKEWARSLAPTIEQRRRPRAEIERERISAENLAALRDEEAQGRVQADRDRKRAERQSLLMYYMVLWRVALLGVLLCGFVYVGLFAWMIREGPRDGWRICNVMPCPTLSAGYQSYY